MSDKIINYLDFDAATVPLQGSNLIEASAGTGKTYSIAILVLRLVLEKAVPVKEILMVTFTRAAVAELEERIRLFIREAYKVSQAKEIKDDNITTMVLDAIDRSDYQTVQQQLRDAVLFLDETSVLTIHSFCQKTLNEFAFETNQLFGAEMIQDVRTLIADEVQQFWRKHITTMKVPLLEKIYSNSLMTGLTRVLEEHLAGKKYLGYDLKEDYTITPAMQEEWLLQLESAVQRKEASEAAMHEYIVTHKDRLQTACEKNTFAKKSLLPCLHEPASFLAAIIEKQTTKYVTQLFQDIIDLLVQHEVVAAEYNNLMHHITDRLYCFAIREVSKGVHLFKERNNLLSYDDMIGNLHRSLLGSESGKLVNVLRKKYQAVFVDEFQDTDRLQYEIFERAFSEDTILFYIGDPKQSIYAWRKADIFTYFKARESVQHVYSMNRNFRSSGPFIAAMNRFFLPEPDFDTFHFGKDGNAISYMHVESPDNNSKGVLYKQDRSTPDTPISVFTVDNKTSLNNGVAAQVALLLERGQYYIGEDKREIRPSDIGVLVRTKSQGQEVKAHLARLGIPSVTVDDSKVLQSDESVYLLYLMTAMSEPDRSSINRALLSPFTGMVLETVLQLDDEVTLQLFAKYKARWEQDGIYTALMDFISDFNVRNTLLHAHTESGERILSNLFQLTELVHQVQSRKNMSMLELISWLQRGIDGMATEGDEYEQRMESDEEAVNIVTIHKSKGLEYKIVMAPFLDFVWNPQNTFFSFRDPDTGDYVGVEKSRITQEQQDIFWQQSEQENRRLLYVAITRAVYKCFIYHNTYKQSKSSTLARFTDVLEKQPDISDLIRFEPALLMPPESRTAIRKTPPRLPVQPSVFFKLMEPNWRKMSYTMLAAKGEVPPRLRAQPQEEPYDSFVFNVLKRGAKTGNLLHFLFENVGFADDSHWDKWLDEAIRRFVPGQEEEYKPMLKTLLQHVLKTTINIEDDEFRLSEVSWSKRIAEFEFDFPVALFSPEVLNALADDQTRVSVGRVGQELEGIMNGKMDLFFQYGEKYYILDWKSNYLGGALEDYQPAALETAMNENNYHLQYLIYTLAAKKYLESRLPGFDYETQFGGVIYLFVRGVRQHEQTGIFTCKPAIERINLLEQSLRAPGTAPFATINY
jgi:exodeoxyribonuclease V beta subunit